MSWKFNPFTKTFDQVGGGDTIITAPDENEGCVVMLQSLTVENTGEASLEEDSCVAIKNGLESAFQRIINQVTITSSGEVIVQETSGVEIKNG